MSQAYKVGLESFVTLVLLYLSGQYPIQSEMMDVPITLQSFVAILLPLRFGIAGSLIGVTAFLTMGAVDLPVFAGGTGGIEKLSGMSGGYLIGFLLVGLTSIALKKRIKKPIGLWVFSIFLVQHALIISSGLIWIALAHDVEITMERFIAPYLPGLFAKSILGAAAYPILGWLMSFNE